MATNRHIQLIRSKVVVDSKPKLPQSSDLMEGELALNYAKGYETISTKNSDGEIVTFTNDAYWDGAIEAATSGKANASDVIALSAQVQTIDSDLETLSGTVIDNEQIVAAALNDLSVTKADKTSVSELSTKVDTISGNVETLTSTKADKTVTDALDTRVGNLETTVGNLSDKVDTFKHASVSNGVLIL